jgi:alkylhydroperoxidase family enzyme
MGKGKQIAVDLVKTTEHPDVIETFARIEAKSGIGNIHRTLANSPAVFKAFIGLSHALRYSTALDPIERELAICCVLERHEGGYELVPHRRFAVVLGASEAQVLNVGKPDRSDLFSERQQAVLRFAARFAADPAERDALPSDNLEAFLVNRERIELGMTLGIYMGLSHFTALFAVPEDDFDAPGAPSMQLAADAAGGL